MPQPILAGGIGINPLFSILQHCCELAQGSSDGGSGAVERRGLRGPLVALLYSAAAPAEFPFRKELEQLAAAAGGSIRLQFFLTGHEETLIAAGWHRGRIGRRQLEAALQWLLSRAGTGSSADAAALVCGPPTMEDAVISDLRHLGLEQEQIRSERW